MTVALVNQGGARLNLPIAGVPPAKGARLTVGVRPEHFGKAAQGNADITVNVDVAEHLGSTSYAYATMSGEELIIERDPKEGAIGLGPLPLSISAARAYAFDGAGKRLR
jgi:lactose/L-arabinose transport system ATP-binding protein